MTREFFMTIFNLDLIKKFIVMYYLKKQIEIVFVDITKNNTKFLVLNNKWNILAKIRIRIFIILNNGLNQKWIFLIK